MIKHIFKDSVFYGLASILGKAISFFLIPIYTHIFSIEDYGTIGVIGSIVGFAGLFMQAGSNNAMQRFYFDSQEHHHKSNVLVSGLLILFSTATAILILFIMLVKSFSAQLDEYEIPTVLLVLGIISLYIRQFIIYAQEIMRVLFAPRKYFILAIVPIVVSTATTLFCLFYIEKTLIMFYVGGLVGTIAGFFIAFLVSSKYFVFKINTKITKEMFHFGYPFIFVGLAYWIFQSSDRLMLLGLTNKTEVGYYHIGTQVASLLLVLITAFGASWSPYAMKMLNEDAEHKKLFSKIATLWLLLLSLATIFLILFAGEILKILTSEEYYAAVTVIPTLLFSNFMIGTMQFTVMGISIAKKTKLLSGYSWMMAFLNIVLNLILIPNIGALGAAIATTISNIILTILYLHRSQKEYYIPYEYRSNFIIIVMTLIIAILCTRYLNIDLLYKVFFFIVLSCIFSVLLYQKIKMFQTSMKDNI